MRIRSVSICFAISILGIGSFSYYHFTRQQPPEENVQIPAEPVRQEEPVVKPKLDIRAALPSRSTPTPKPAVATTTPPKKSVKPNADAHAKAEARRKQRETQYWQHHLKNFDRQMNRLNQEKNKNNRNNLIQAIARYVQVDTLSTIEWAMGLEDPAERKAALAAINKNALSGIGARIELDKRGLPKIRETTVLSAINSTGLVEAGDYISGLVKPDGSIVQFEGLSLQQVVQNLRGKPGTKTHLMMERISPDGAPYYFDVPVQRALIVVQPPL